MASFVLLKNTGSCSCLERARMGLTLLHDEDPKYLFDICFFNNLHNRYKSNQFDSFEVAAGSEETSPDKMNSNFEKVSRSTHRHFHRGLKNQTHTWTKALT